MAVALEVLGEVWAIAAPGGSGPVDVRVFVRGVTNLRLLVESAQPVRVLSSGVPMSSLVIQNLGAIPIEIGNDRSLVYGQGMRIAPNSILANGSLSPGGPGAAVIESYARAALPAVGNRGRLAELLDYDRGIWIDDGVQWYSTTREVFNLKAFDAKGDGVADDTAAIVAWLAAAGAAKGLAYAPNGTYLFTGPIAIPHNVIVRGAGMEVTIFKTASAGDGFQALDPVNGSTVSSIVIEDLQVWCTNGANVGGAIDQVGGTFFYINRVHTNGFAYGVIFDQTELGFIDECRLEFALTACLWLVNGVADHSPGALAGFTNLISVRRTQFNINAAATGIFDDGGITHWIENCNFNGGVTAIWLGNVIGAVIDNCEYEGQTNYLIRFEFTSSKGTVVGNSYGVSIRSNNLVSNGGGAHDAIHFTSAASVSVTGNFFSTNAPFFCLSGVGNVNGLTVLGNANAGSGKTVDSFNATAMLFMPGIGGFAESFQAIAQGLNIRTREVIVANNGIAQLLHIPFNAGFVVDVIDDTQHAAVYVLEGGVPGAIKVGGSVVYTAGAPGTAASSNVYWSGANARYEIENKTGAQRTYKVFERTSG
jgi:hypothetical protein